MRRMLAVAVCVLGASAVVGCGSIALPPPAPEAVTGNVVADLLAAPVLDVPGGRIAPAPRTDGPPGAAEIAEPRATMVVVFASWCPNCQRELDTIGDLRAAHPALRIIGVSYRQYEEWGQRGDAYRLRTYVGRYAPWLRVAIVDDAVFAELGNPPKIPTIYVYDAGGAMVGYFDRRQRPMPDERELGELLAHIGA